MRTADDLAVVVITHDPRRPKEWLDRAAKSCGDFRVVVMVDSRHLGPAYMRHCALHDQSLEAYRHGYIVFLDDDDWFVPDGLNRLVRAASEGKHSCVLGGRISVDLETGRAADFNNLESYIFDADFARSGRLIPGVPIYEVDRLKRCGGYNSAIPHCASLDATIRYVDAYGPGLVLYPSVAYKGMHSDNRMKREEQPAWLQWVCSQPRRVSEEVASGNA